MDDATRLRLTEWGEAYWQNLAQNKPPRFWWYGWPRWAKPIFIGGDERLRKTIVIGPLVIALWYCHCEHCNDERARTLAIRR